MKSTEAFVTLPNGNAMMILDMADAEAVAAYNAEVKRHIAENTHALYTPDGKMRRWVCQCGEVHGEESP